MSDKPDEKHAGKAQDESDDKTDKNEAARPAEEQLGKRTELVASSVRYGKLAAPIGTPEVNIPEITAGR